MDNPEVRAQILRLLEQLEEYSKKSKRFPKHGPRRQAIDQIIMMLHAEIRVFKIFESGNAAKLLSDETIEGNDAWLK